MRSIPKWSLIIGNHVLLLLDSQSQTECFAKKLLCLKHKTIDWAREKRVRDDHLLNDIEFELANLVGADGRGFESTEAIIFQTNLVYTMQVGIRIY